jgi:hypothetical protein
MESLDRPYGDDEVEYRTVQPELNAEVDDATDRPAAMPPTSDLDDRAHDPAFQAVIEGGGGVSEGFEIAEGELIENAENPPEPDLTADGFDLDDPGTDVDEDVRGDVEKTLDDNDPGDTTAGPQPDLEALRSTAAYGEADEIDVTEVVRDPEEEAQHGDDAGAGPGVAFDR